jgi:hypothetical protein
MFIRPHSDATQACKILANFFNPKSAHERALSAAASFHATHLSRSVPTGEHFVMANFIIAWTD